jgi:adenosylhomocysteine nucleosidase
MGISIIAAKRVLFVMANDHEYGARLRTRIDPLITGVGPIESAIATTSCLKQLVADDSAPHVVVSLGSAGSRRCELGRVYQINSVSWRDMDASRIGFEKGVTPFSSLPAVMLLPTPFTHLPAASPSTGSNIVGGADYDAIEADLVDMETFAVLRACQVFGVSMIGLRGVSDGPGELEALGGWTQLLSLLDERLADALDHLPSALTGV